MNIRILNTHDEEGGAARIARLLHEGYLQAGHESGWVVRTSSGRDARVSIAPRDVVEASLPRRAATWSLLQLKHVFPALRAVHGDLRDGRPLSGTLRRALGGEDIDYPGTARLLRSLVPETDLFHLHNLHGGYFDLASLPELSRRRPVVLTLHDEWMLTGHCAYTLECSRWLSGCGRCPDLMRYPRVVRDRTRANRRLKRNLYRHSRLHVAAPSEWLLRRARESILQEGDVEFRLMRQGVDLSLFRPRDRAEVRAELGLSADAFVVVTAAEGLQKSGWKDYATLRQALAVLGGERNFSCHVIALGGETGRERIGPLLIESLAYVPPEKLVRYYQAADLCAHSTHAENYPNVVMEAMACGCPVAATAVGGIPEQIRPFPHAGGDGFLIEPRSSPGWVEVMEGFARDRELRHRASGAAARHARAEFDSRAMVDRYLAWFAEILASSPRS